ncbi:MAG TPA: signal peptidase I [Candidatus Eisenbergiella intestinipullorum]|nr:signal peptidase I [Candidatus Eisenbergiella intestinipullorum]
MRRNKGLSFYRKRKKVNAAILAEVLKYILGIAISVFLAVVIVYLFGLRTGIIGTSMEPELANGQEVLVNRFAYKLANPRAGDVIVFLPNGNQNTRYYVKRVVACPGDTVQITGGILYVNGEPREDAYDLIADAGIAENEIRLKDGEYFVMGDNCNSSEDSRSGNIGPVQRDHIVGEAWFKLGNATGSTGLVH